MAQPKTIRVFPNPYHLDHEGRPSGAVLLDPVDHLAYGSDEEQRRFVGAARTVTVTRKATKYEPEHLDITWEHTCEAVTLPYTQYYHARVMGGDLVCADAASWRTLGCDPATFRDPLVLLGETKARAIGRHAGEYGPDAVPSETHGHWDAHLTATTIDVAAGKVTTAPLVGPTVSPLFSTPKRPDGDS